jgi:hypothetical protein
MVSAFSSETSEQTHYIIHYRNPEEHHFDSLFHHKGCCKLEILRQHFKGSAEILAAFIMLSQSLERSNAFFWQCIVQEPFFFKEEDKNWLTMGLRYYSASQVPPPFLPKNNSGRIDL